ncbi:hypothetical protein ABN584_14040 [Gloeocapsa sp. BRSZ]
MNREFTSREQRLPAQTRQKPKLGDRVRSIADQLKQETELQIKATARILGAAAQIAENHDQLIDEVFDMVEEDIEQNQAKPPIYTTNSLKQQFKTLRDAKTHFGLKAHSWVELVNKLNSSSPPSRVSGDPFNSISERLNAIESELRMMRVEISQILSLLKQLVREQE